MTTAKRTPASRLEKRIQALPDDVRDRVVERAAILWEDGVSEEEANARAFEMEAGAPAAPGVAQAKKRRATPPASGTGTDD